MITATAAIATTPKAMNIAMFGLARNAPMAPGAWLTIPAKITKLMPLPIPRSVISSPIHISAIEPAVSVAICVSVSKLPRSNVPVRTLLLLSSARNPYDWSRAIGTARYRVYWVILLRPNSPSRLSAWREGTTPCINCMMIDALM